MKIRTRPYEPVCRHEGLARWFVFMAAVLACAELRAQDRPPHGPTLNVLRWADVREGCDGLSYVEEAGVLHSDGTFHRATATPRGPWQHSDGRPVNARRTADARARPTGALGRVLPRRAGPRPARRLGDITRERTERGIERRWRPIVEA